MFVDKAADLEKAKAIVLDSKVDYPAACNAMVSMFPIVNFINFRGWPTKTETLPLLQETLLVHEDLVGTGGLEMLAFALQSAGQYSLP